MYKLYDRRDKVFLFLFSDQYASIKEEIAMKQENEAKAKSKNLKTNSSKKIMKKRPVPDSIRKIQRDQVFKILHPYDFD